METNHSHLVIFHKEIVKDFLEELVDSLEVLEDFQGVEDFQEVEDSQDLFSKPFNTLHSKEDEYIILIIDL